MVIKENQIIEFMLYGLGLLTGKYQIMSGLPMAPYDYV